VWLFDIADSTLTRFGFDSTAHDAEWLPDGSGLVFAAIRGGSIGVFRRRFDRGRAVSILVRPQQLSMHAITRDSTTGIAVAVDDGAFDLMAVGLDRKAYDTVLASRYNEG